MGSVQTLLPQSLAAQARPVLRPVAGVLAILILASCIGGPGAPTTVLIRNESPGVIGVRIERQADTFLGGTNREIHGLAALRPDFCAAAGFGVRTGHVRISVWGPGVSATTHDFDVTPNGPSEVFVLVKSSGEVVYPAKPPIDKMPCQSWAEVPPPAQ